MFQIILDGLSILYEYKEGILVFFFAIFSFGFLSIKHTIDSKVDVKIRLLASFGIGSVVLCVISYVLVLLSHFLPFLLRPVSFAVFFAGFVLLKGSWLEIIKIAHDLRVATGAIILLLLLLIRLAFLKRIILPPYSDSPVHYQIVFGLLHPEASINSKLSLDAIFSNYYHFGFHSLAAWLSSIINLESGTVILLLGQLFLVILPLSIFFLTYVITSDINGALFAGMFAAFGWHMPAFAVNWGKYPAVSSLAVLPSVIAILILWFRSGSKEPKIFFWGFVIVLGATLLHTRIIICILLAVVCCFLANRLPIGAKAGFLQSVRYVLLYIISLWPLMEILNKYYNKLPVTIIFLGLLPFAFQAFPKLAVGAFLYTFGLWLIAIVPNYLNPDYRTMLDRQFLEMILYIPFSLLGGAGFAGFIKTIGLSGVLRWLATIVMIGCMLPNFLNDTSVYPDTCCDYFKENDRLAFAWIQEKTSEHALLLISAFDNNGQIVGSDAGAWISPLTGRSVNKLPFNTDWSSLAEIEKICALGTDEIYIYVGDRGYSFDDSQLAQAKWAKLVFKAGVTSIYQASECPK